MTTRAGTNYSQATGMEELVVNNEGGRVEGRDWQEVEERSGGSVVGCVGIVVGGERGYDGVQEGTDTQLEGRGNGGLRSGGGDIVERMMQTLLEDRRRHEVELVEERRRWEEERRRRELEFEEERRRQQAESARREEQAWQQMQVLQSLVEGVHLQGEAAQKKAENDRAVIPRLTEQDDIVSYLTMFERLMMAFEVKKERWAFKLALSLSGKAQKAYSALPAEEAGDYKLLKEAILRRYDITDESYRQRFCSGRRGKEESNKELVVCLNDLATKWLKERKSREEVVDQIVLEQFLKTLPDDIRVYIRERSPKTSEEAAKVADDYLQARKEVISWDADKRGGDRSSGRRCHRCGKLGHLAKECQAQHLVLPQRQEKVADHSAGKNPKKDLKDIECYNCHRKGHYSSNCPQNAMFNSERMVRCGVISEVKRRPFIAQVGVMKPGFVEGESVNDILVDSGCARTMVHEKLVPEGKVKEGEAVAMQCVHGDTVLYPVAEISLEVDGKQHVVEAAVSSTLPLSVCLGTDIPGWASMLADKKEVSKEKAFAVTTRAQKLCEKRKEEEQLRKERECEVTPKTLNEDAEWMCEMDDDLFGMSKERVWKTRKEKREERQRRCQLQVDVVADKEGGAGEEVANGWECNWCKRGKR